MAVAPSTGMDKSEMQAVLKKAAPDSPISFAFAQGKDAQFALLKLDKMKNPRICGKLLEEQFKDAKNLRWGTLVIDSDVDSALARFTLNKPAGGMAKRLTKTLKGTGISKVELLLEDGSLVEAGSDADEEQDPAASAPAQAESATPPDAADPAKQLAALLKRLPAVIEAAPDAKDGLVALATAARLALKDGNVRAASDAIASLSQAIERAPAAPPSAAAAAPEAPAPDKATLSKALGDLLKQIPSVLAESPDAKAGLLKLAGDATVAVKGPDLAAAGTAIAALRAALQQSRPADAPASQPAPEPQAAPPTVQVDEKRLRDAVAGFHDELAEIGNRVETLKATLRATDDPNLKRVADEGLTDLTGGMRVAMTKALFEVLQSQDAKRVRAAKIALKLSGKMRDFVGSNDLFDLLDRNPYNIALNLKKSLGASLTRLDGEMKAALAA